MLEIYYDENFLKFISKIKDGLLKEKIKKHIKKIIEDPEIGKPMRYSRKETREVYISPYRLAYSFLNEKLIFLSIYHKDKQ